MKPLLLRLPTPDPLPEQSLFHRLRIHTQALTEIDVRERRNLRRLDLAAAAPEHIRVRHRPPDLREIRVDGRLVREHRVLLRSVRHGHDVHVAELWPALAPVAVREDVEASDLTAGLNLAARRHGPMEKRVESRHAFARLQRL